MNNGNREEFQKLEERIAHQDHVIEELSDQVSQQWKQIDALKKAMRTLGKQIAELEESVVGEAPITKPPHW